MVISVPCSGSRFAADLTGYVLYYHVWGLRSIQDVVSRNGDEVIVAPVRRPEKVWRTFWQRFHKIPGRTDNSHELSIPAAWRQMQTLSERHDIVWLPIDTPDRDDYLAVLSDRLGVELVTDWAPVGARPERYKQKQEPKKDWSWVYDLPFMRKIYANA